MGGKTLTRADLAEAVVQKVGLPRNKSQEMVELILREISTSLSDGDAVKLSSFGSFGIRYEGPAHRPQPEDGGGGADHAAPRAGIPAEQYHEGYDQRGPRCAVKRQSRLRPRGKPGHSR